MQESLAPSQVEVDRILQRRKKDRGGRACYPCRKRKVRCDSAEKTPCTNCTKRGHPEICHYEAHISPRSPNEHFASGEPLIRTSTRTESDISAASPPYAQRDTPYSYSNAGGPLRGLVEAATSSAPSRDYSPLHHSKHDSFLGENSAASFVRGHLGAGGEKMTQDIRPVLGLQNTSKSYPYDKARTTHQVLEELNDALPRSGDVLKYFHLYRTLAFPFNPTIVDIDEFENFVCVYLDRIGISERGSQRMLREESLERDVAQISLLLATLASGSQFSDLKVSERMTVSQDFARRSFQCLRLANFLLRPTIEAVQALLILGHVMQNDGQSDGAWAFLGMTVRLAQSLGLHSDRSSADLSDVVRSKRKDLWRIVMWQDSLLSLCYDRPPALAFYKMFKNPPTEANFNYVQGMFEVSRIGLSVLVYSYTADEVLDVERLLQHVAQVQGTCASTDPHLQSKDRCYTLQQRQEFFAFRLQTSFLISLICRPAFRAPATPSRDAQQAELISKGKESLMDATRAFLDLHAISVYARRSWSMTHEGLSSALLLGILGETRREEVRKLQERIIDVLAGSEDAQSIWLTKAHLRALRALRFTLGNATQPSVQEQAMTRQRLDGGPDANMGGGHMGQATEAFDFDFQNLQPQADMSALSYFDSIIWDPVMGNDSFFASDLPQQEDWGL